MSVFSSKITTPQAMYMPLLYIFVHRTNYDLSLGNGKLSPGKKSLACLISSFLLKSNGAYMQLTCKFQPATCKH